MPTIATNTYRLPILEKLVQGATIIAQSTDNPNVPGNEAALARLTAAQAALDASNVAYEILRMEAKALLSARDNNVAEWNAAINGLAALTESITDGDPVKILSAGFSVRSPKTPSPPVTQVIQVRVTFDGEPGYSNLTWKRDPGASAYRVQFSPAPITDESWTESGIAVEAKFRANGAIPGQPGWYRVAAIDTLGQGPWSAPAPRPVM